jgi:hypothetical protein
MDSKDLLAMIGDDDLGLLKVKPKQSAVKTGDDRLVESFQEINQFIANHNREPESGGDIQEHKLASRLRKLRADNEKITHLKEYDVHGLLNGTVKEISSVEDIIDSDEFGLLDGGDQGLFDLKHVPKETTMPDYVAKRKKCDDFESFEQIFLTCQADLESGKRKLVKFQNEQEIDKGYFFVLKGILLYVAEIGERKTVKGKVNARLRCIFGNGTESDLLLRSLSAELYKHGRRVTAHDDTYLDNFMGIAENDERTGFIYILKSLSNEPEIAQIQDLYKIGYSTTPVEERIKHAADDPTYLKAPVAIVTTFECLNFNPQKLEQLLHNFFGSSCLEVDVFDHSNKRHTPREWFIAPLDVIEKVVDMILNEAIVNYRYNTNTNSIELK